MNRPFLSKEDKKKLAVSRPDKVRPELKAKSDKQKSDKQWLFDSLTRALKEVKLMEEGKLPKPNINDLFKD
ncbi:hypothetical protein MUK70_08825 [Dyadobacter chenwenxiniae]|uniref:Uncharacterized protein n=1 Tax=Dyadobacter chenwenxiniae TaxID=2906456 RepID=A0A9X1PKS8_9BACT|nr:hypothetical protein [Dyadobacter chenwenxiniae]MCF0052003.1 hypothetical protein [Dyadobacter chenwenxiniae]MCF0062738.1 hypothetical protein [Dyadobacter chenwenxiniae]UON85085.1 hypothetical protein MUK70_08825 [Dyadobacter chenwenxiniae]